MADEITIVINLKDNMSQKFTTIRNAMNPFRKDLERLNREVQKFNEQKINLKVDLTTAKREMTDAERQFRKTGNELERQQYIAKKVSFENVRQNYTAISEAAKQAEKNLISAERAMSKVDNHALSVPGSDKSSSGTNTSNFSEKMMGSEIGESLLNSFSNLATTMITSSTTETTGKAIGAVFSSTLGGVVTGAMAGGIPGAVVGGVAGLISGSMDAYTQIYMENEEAFKAFRQQAYENVVKEREASIQNGSTIAAQREMDEVTFNQLIGGNMTGTEFLAEMKTLSDAKPYQYQDLTSMSRAMAPTLGDNSEGMLQWLSAIGDAGSVLGLGTEDMSTIAMNVGNIQSNENASLEYINPLIERGIDVWDYLEGHFKNQETGQFLTKEELISAVSSGELKGADVAEVILQGMQQTFGVAAEQQANTYIGLESTLQGYQENMDAAYGEGFNEERKKGIQAEIDSLSGESGEQAEEANRLIGQYYASLENLQEQYARDARDLVMGSAEDSEVFDPEAMDRLKQLRAEYEIAIAEENGAEAGRILEEAKIFAQMEYNASEGAQQELDSQIALIQSIGENASVKQEYYNTGKKLADAFTEGLSASFQRAQKSGLFDILNPLVKANDGISYQRKDEQDRIKEHMQKEGAYVPPTTDSGTPVYSSRNAWGLSYVPYNNFPALLHQGERVLTASEARQADRASGGVTVNVNGNFSVRSTEDIDLIAQRIASEMVAAQQIT